MMTDRLARGLCAALLSLVAGCSTSNTTKESSIGANSPAYAGLVSSVPEVETYDRRLCKTIQRHWEDLLERQETLRSIERYRRPKTLEAARTIRRESGRENGKVVVDFVLTADGRVEDLRVTSQTVSAELSELCLQAVRNAEPFSRWPEDIRVAIASEKREIRFTFNYRDAPTHE